MTTLQLIHDAVGAAGLFYAGIIAITSITALATTDPDQRRAALDVLALLTRGTIAGGSDRT